MIVDLKPEGGEVVRHKKSQEDDSGKRQEKVQSEQEQERGLCGC